NDPPHVLGPTAGVRERPGNVFDTLTFRQDSESGGAYITSDPKVVDQLKELPQGLIITEPNTPSGSVGLEDGMRKSVDAGAQRGGPSRNGSIGGGQERSNSTDSTSAIQNSYLQQSTQPLAATSLGLEGVPGNMFDWGGWDNWLQSLGTENMTSLIPPSQWRPCAIIAKRSISTFVTIILLGNHPLSSMSMDLTSYLAQRAQLIAEDTSLRVDLKKLASLTPTESAAESIVRKIRNAEAEKIWSHKNEDLEHPFPGMAFLTAKTTIESTRLFKIVKDMPKGALLHAHLEATVNARVLLELAIMYENICVRTPARVTAENVGSILPDFYVMPKGVGYDTSPSITSEGYDPNSHVSTAKARNDWPEALGGPEGFDTWVIRGLTINPQEAYGTHNTVIKIWDKFITCFSVSRGILGYEPVYRRFLRHLFESCVEDGISYAEIRMNFTIK
ncbi:hypothetical protein FRC20_001897, partial [Serendipita sp. 405]